MVIESTEAQLRRSRRLADMAGVAPTNAEVVTIWPCRPSSVFISKIVSYELQLNL